MAVGPTDPERFDEGKQAKPMHALETTRPLKFFAPGVANEKVVMEVRDGSDVPGVASQGAREKTVYVVDQIGDDHFDDFLGEAGGKRRACRRILKRSTRRMHLVKFGYGSIPNSLGEELNRCSSGL